MRTLSGNRPVFEGLNGHVCLREKHALQIHFLNVALRIHPAPPPLHPPPPPLRFNSQLDVVDIAVSEWRLSRLEMPSVNMPD